MTTSATPGTPPSRRLRTFGKHSLALAGLFAVAVCIATVLGELWPFDLRFSVLITAGGMAVLAIAWWPAAVAIGRVAALLHRTVWRLLLWPLAVVSMGALHASFGPHHGFMPLSDLGLLGTLRLYTIPVALPILMGSLLRDALLPRCVKIDPKATGARSFQ